MPITFLNPHNASKLQFNNCVLLNFNEKANSNEEYLNMSDGSSQFILQAPA